MSREHAWTDALDGLRYVAASPPHNVGGFHPQTVEIAKAAIAQLLTLKQERDEASEMWQKEADHAQWLNGELAAAERQRDDARADLTLILAENARLERVFDAAERVEKMELSKLLALGDEVARFRADGEAERV